MSLFFSSLPVFLNSGSRRKLTEMDDELTSSIVADCIRHRLMKKNVQWPGGPPVCPPEKINFVVRRLSDEFDERYRENFANLASELHVTATTAYPVFTTVVNNLFQGEVKWGRIIALLTFGGTLAVRCLEEGLPQLVNSVHAWLVTYIRNDLSQWIMEHGGWEGLVQHFDVDANRNESPWKRIGELGPYLAIGGLAALTLGAFVTQK